MAQKVELSFEFFPPRTDAGLGKLMAIHQDLAALSPDFFSVTYGAGGSTQEGTYNAVKAIMGRGSDAAPHLTCIGASRSYIAKTIEDYLALGVNRFVVLRGDLPGGMVERGDFKYASDLLAFIRAEYGEELLLEVGAYPDFHPESVNPMQDLENFKRKVDAGASSAITQYFFNADSYFAYLEEVTRLGVEIAVTPGIMPITNFATLVRFSDACGAEIPRWIRRRLEQYQDDEVSLKAFGLDVVTHLCLDLLDNDVHGLHFYTLNKSEPTLSLCDRLGFKQSVA